MLYRLREDHGVENVNDPRQANFGERVARGEVGPFFVSTVFLGIPHGTDEQGRPLLFETMIFLDDGSMLEEYCERHATWDEAETRHQFIVDTMREWFAQGQLGSGKVRALLSGIE